MMSSIKRKHTRYLQLGGWVSFRQDLSIEPEVINTHAQLQKHSFPINNWITLGSNTTLLHVYGVGHQMLQVNIKACELLILFVASL
jgi:hypothetical protein